MYYFYVRHARVCNFFVLFFTQRHALRSGVVVCVGDIDKRSFVTLVINARPIRKVNLTLADATDIVKVSDMKEVLCIIEALAA